MTGGPICREILIVSSSQQAAEQLVSSLPQGLSSRTQIISSGAELRRHAADAEGSVAVIVAPLQDENALNLARDLAGRWPLGLLLLVRRERFDQTAPAAAAFGVPALSLPVSRGTLETALRFTAAAAVRLTGFARQRDTMRSKVEDLRLVGRAKSLLMEHLGMTEPEAHRYIEKQAMDRSRKRRDIAEKIIRTYGE